MSIKYGIGLSPLTEKIYIGKQNTAKQMWVGEKNDITQEFLAIMHQYIPDNTSREIVNNETTNIFLNTKKDAESIDRTIAFLTKLKSEL